MVNDNHHTIRISILVGDDYRIIAPDHIVSETGDKTVYSPRSKDSRLQLRGQLIGKGFHWQQKINTLLPGIIEVTHNIETGERHVINIVDIETYLMCVIGSEMNPDAPLEFLKASAIVARSWVLGKILHSHPEDGTDKIIEPNRIITWEDTSDHEGFDVCSDDHCQRYQGIRPVSGKAREAIRSTARLVICDSENDIVDARFSKSCGGQTESFSTCWQNIEPSCLESVECKWCCLNGMDESEKIKFLKTIVNDYDMSAAFSTGWEHITPIKVITENLKKFCNFHCNDIFGIEVLKRGKSSRAYLINILTDKGTLTIGKELLIRRVLSDKCLYSSAFQIEKGKDQFRFIGKGWGHGVGMCQIGAANMARNGYNHEDIIYHYYKGSKILPLSNIRLSSPK